MFTTLPSLHAIIKRKISFFNSLHFSSLPFFLCLTFIMLSFSGMANSGDLDQAFGSGGLLNLPNRYVSTIAKQPDGKLLMGRGEFVDIIHPTPFSLIRYNLDGSVDKTFGNGEVLTDFNGGVNSITSIVVEPNGKIVAAGRRLGSPGISLVVARYNPDGSLDNSFDVDGKVVVDSFSSSIDDYFAIIQSDEKIVVTSYLGMIRFNADGSKDNTFGVSGQITFGSYIFISAIAVQNDNKIVAVGYDENNNFIVKRYYANGTPDPGFGAGGQVSTDLGGNDKAIDITIQNDGKILVGGTTTVNDILQFALVRYNVDGSLDTNFDGDGILISPALASTKTLVLQADGKIVAAGNTSVARFNTNGSPDNSFDGDGLVILPNGYTRSSGAVISGNDIYVALLNVYSGSLIAAISLGNTVASGLNYRYYEGHWNTLPNFTELTPVKTGTSSNVDINVRPDGVNDYYALLWEGYITLPTAGQYTFETVSDDGSKLYFNTVYNAGTAALVTNDGLHPATPASGSVTINAGTYPIAISYFQGTNSESMQVYWSGPGIPRQLIPDAAFTLSGTPPPPSTPGLNFKYFEGSYTTLPDFSLLTPVKSGTSSNVDISVRPAGVNDYYAFLWEGYITLPTTGRYTFETVSDDGSKVYFNTVYSAGAAALVTNDGLHPATPASGSVTVAAGTYPIAISYFQGTNSESMQVYWSGPGIPRQLIPNAAFTLSGTPPPPSIPGLNYKYFEGSYTSLPDFNLLTPVKTGTSPNVDISVRPAGVNDYYAFLWEGYITLPTAGQYTFETVSDDGSKLYFNTVYNAGAAALVANDGLHPATPASGSVTINAGTYPIAISYFQGTNSESMQVYWSGPGIPRQLIPDAAFTLTNADGINITMSSNQNSMLQTAGSAGNFTTKQIYPNPFSESFTLDFYNSFSTNDISIGIYDLNGRKILVNHPGKLPAGNNIINININGINIKDGIYIVQVQKNGITWKTMKVVKMKR